MCLGVCVLCVNPVWGPFGESECFRPRSTRRSTRAPRPAAGPQAGALPGPFGQRNGDLPWLLSDTGPRFLSWNQPGASVAGTLTVASLPPPTALKYLTLSRVRN